MEKRDTRAEIIRVGTEMIASQGYNATGIDAVLKGAGVPKGSFYHYFGSKEDFGLAIIDQFARLFDERLDACLADHATPPLQRIRNYLEGGLERLDRNKCCKGCLVGNLGQELADLNERFRERLDGFFRSWVERFAACLREAQAAGGLDKGADAAVLAGFILSGYEGAILRAKVQKSTEPLRDYIEVLFVTVLRK
jgi:TetR/AcrR family transcriptional repressor of nem operon